MNSNLNDFESLSDQCKLKFDLVIERYQNNNKLEKRTFKSYENCQEHVKSKGKKILWKF